MSVTTVPLLEDLQGPWSGLQVELVDGSPTTKPLRDVFPFISVTDLKRLLWAQMDGNPRWAPERVFLAVRTADGTYRPLEFHWKGQSTMADPVPAENRLPSSILTDETGKRKPVSPVMTGGLTVEVALAPDLVEGAPLPTLTAICLAALTPTDADAITPALYNGFYQFYFPWITAPAQIIDSAISTAELRGTYAAIFPYNEDRTGRISIVQRALAARLGGTSVNMTTMVRLRWTLPSPSARPDSLERTFYALPANETIPFLRFFPAGGIGAPLLKLGLKSDGSPLIDDPRIFAQYVNQVAPNMTSAVILARVPMTSPHVERGAAFTLYMFEDGTCDITLEVPQRGMTYIAAVAADAQRILGEVITSIGFPADTPTPLRDVHATFNWKHPNRAAAPLSTARLLERVSTLTPFFEPIPLLPDDRALAAFNWRAISNYESESAQFAFITQLIQRTETVTPDEDPSVLRSRYVETIAAKFGLTAEGAETLLETWFDRRGTAVAPSAAMPHMAVPTVSSGINIAIAGSHPEYTVRVHGADMTYLELQRVLSVVSVLMGAPTSDLRLTPPGAAVAAVGEVVEVADAVQESAAVAAGGGVVADVEGGEADPELAALMAAMGLGGGDADAMAAFGFEEEPTVSEPTPAPVPTPSPVEVPPSLDAAVAAIPAEEECGANPWLPGEPPLTIAKEYYMERLNRVDTEMFGYTGSDTVKGYSKSCQRREDRQPNIMTTTEYARVRRCYEDRVRFVDLPPRSPADLPAASDEDYSVDQQTGRPLWTVYNYESRVAPGQFNYLMCSEFWCERDNMPLLREEFEGTQGRGFTKPPNTCPFCGGSVIAEMTAPKPGESVIVRKAKSATGKVHSYVGTLTRGILHPTYGVPLPCCDTTPRLLKHYIKEAAAGRLGAAADAEAAIVAAVEDHAEPPPEAAVAAESRVDYERILSTMQSQYILGADKVLTAGKVAILPPALDTFFGQQSQRMIESRGIRPTFVAGANVFVRIGTDIFLREPGLNLFAGLTPLLGYRTPEETLTKMFLDNTSSRHLVRAFESANYGTLVHEFSARSTLTDAEIAGSLQGWATTNGYSLEDANRAHLTRLYKAWDAYIAYMRDIRVPKQLRHMEHMMAQPGLMTPMGLLLAVIEEEGDSVRVVCPAFGIPPASLFGTVPIAFVHHNRRTGSWNPIVLYNNTQQAVKFFGERTPELDALPTSMKASIRRWITEWRTSSTGCGRPAPPPHVWTPDRDTGDLPRLSQLRMRMKGHTPIALVRDRSNRVAGVLFKPVAGEGPSLFVPCLDDGILAMGLPRIYEASMLPLAPVDAYIAFYTELGIAGLRPTKILTRGASDEIVGLQVAMGTMIPTASVPSTSGLPTQQIDEFPWERDVLPQPNVPTVAGAILEETTASVEEQMTEAYQYLRLTLNRWFQRDARREALTANIKRLIKSNIPLYEKRKRMDILLEPLIREWVAPHQTDERRTLPMLREDCPAIPDEGRCRAAGVCSWSGGRCMIHAPHRTETVSPIRIFTARLADEILRYAVARRELMEGSVTAIRTPRGIVRSGDELFMALRPNEVAASVMRRLGFMGQIPVAMPEEILRFEGAEEDEEEDADADAEESLAPPPPTAPDAILPPSWISAGLTVPSPPAGLDDAHIVAFAGVTGHSIPDWWQKAIEVRRKKYKFPGDPTRPFTWSLQDMAAIAAIKVANVVFMHQNPISGKIVLDRWIVPPKAIYAGIPPAYIIFWGPRQLLVSKGSEYALRGEQLPPGFMELFVGHMPMAEADVMGSLNSIEVGEVVPAVVQPPAPQMAELATPAPQTGFNIEGTAAAPNGS